MTTAGLIFIIGSIISAIIAGYWFYTTKREDQPIKVKDLFAFTLVELFAFLLSWAGVLAFIFAKYGDVIIIKGKKENKNEE